MATVQHNNRHFNRNCNLHINPNNSYSELQVTRNIVCEFFIRSLQKSKKNGLVLTVTDVFFKNEHQIYIH